MPTGTRASPSKIPTDEISAVAQTSTRVAEALEELCLDALEGLRAMLESGSTEDRIAVIKTLGPLLRDIGSTNEVATGTTDAEAAREILMGNWDHLRGSDG